jgi:hypothetical protein
MKNQRKPIYKIGTESRDIEPFLRFILDLARELKKRDTAAVESKVSHIDNSPKLSIKL